MVLHDCPPADKLAGYSAGVLPKPDAEALDTHLRLCTACLVRLDDLARRPDPLVAALRRRPGPPGSTDQPGTATPRPLVGVGPDCRAAAPSAGDSIGGYRVLGELGRGGMGRVYRAAHPRLDQEVALKVLRPELDSAPILARFAAERQALALMDHPNIARVSDGGATDDGRPYFVMELVRGVPITDHCDEHRLGLDRRLGLFTDVCRAVQHAHQKGVIHRDIKPSNVLVAECDGRAIPKVIDFGVARAVERRSGAETEDGMLVGTPDYMSPEQAALIAHDVDTRADVYALGALLYELLTGVPPLARPASTPILERLRVIREEAPPAPSARLTSAGGAGGVAARRDTDPERLVRRVRGELDWIVLKALAKDRDRRYPTAAALAEDVGRFLNEEPVEAGPPSRAYRLRKFVRRNRAALVAAGAFAVLLVGATVASTALAVWADRERVRAESAEGVAVAAAGREREARDLAERRLGQVERANGILTGVFRDLNPRGQHADEVSLRVSLGARLDRATAELDGDAVGDPRTVAALQDSLGLTQLNLGHTDKAVALLTKASRARESLLGPDHLETLSSRNNLAKAYLAAGRTTEGLEIAEDVVRRAAAGFGPDHPYTLSTRETLAALYLKAGRTREAVEVGEQALALRAARLGPTHPDTISTRTNLAVAYSDAGRDRDAIRLQEETLQLCVAALGPKHPSTLTARGNLANSYRMSGRAVEATPMLEENLAARTAALGPKHPQTLQSRAALGQAYLAGGRTADAIALHEETLKLRFRELGPLHTDTLRSRALLADAYLAVGRADEAIAALEEAHRLRTLALGPLHPDTLQSGGNLAVMYRRAGRRSDAVKLQEETFKLRAEVLGPDHPSTQRSAGNLANAYATVDRLADAERVLRELVASRQRTLAVDDPVLADTRARLGLVLLHQNKYADAEQFYREALAARAAKDPGGLPAADARSRLGESLVRQKKYADAEPLLLQAHDAMTRIATGLPAEDGARVTHTLKLIVLLYSSWGKPNEAARWRAKLKPADKTKLLPAPPPNRHPGVTHAIS